MRARTAALLTVLVTLVATMSGIAQDRKPTTLAALRDTARPLLIFGGANDARAQQQLSDLAAHAAEARDRDMRVIVINVVPSSSPGTSALPQATFAPAEAAYARQRFRIALHDFAIILLGKDGGEKLRSSNPIPWHTLASTIDAMPMRQDEMRQP